MLLLLRPVLFFLLLMVAAALLFRVLRPIKRKLEAPDPAFTPGRCPRCGYQANIATASTPFCPECGTVRLSDPRHPQPPPPTATDANPSRPVKKVQNQAEQ